MARARQSALDWPAKHITIPGAPRYLLAQVVPGDRLGRTYAELIASIMIACACRGDGRALREILKATEGAQENAETQQQQAKLTREELLRKIMNFEKDNKLGRER